MDTRLAPTPMTAVHRGTNPAGSPPWLWTLPAGAVERLEAAPVTRWLSVCEGRVWLTRTSAAPGPGQPGRQAAPEDDLWLFAGDRAEIEPGSQWVVEAWPSARMTLLEEHAAPAPARATLSASWRRAWRALAATTLGAGPLAA